ncbi:MAG: hypothetical protein WKF84_13825 [Pyrinomonadaceae bacterium]
MEKIFGRDGLIARAHPEYEYRPGQIQMAEAVLRAFRMAAGISLWRPARVLERRLLTWCPPSPLLPTAAVA